MSQEIYYTSAPEGLKRGSSGFSTVGATEGMPKALWDRLETLSAYRHHFGMAGGGGDPGLNPVSWAHYLLNVANTTYHVLSRVCDSGVDHTQRTNAFAHHLVLEQSEMAAARGGPAWMLAHPGVMTQSWDGRVGKISRVGGLPTGEVSGGVCRAWSAATGDAGWGGVLADVFAKSPTKPVCILFAPGQEILPLLAETIALLPAAARWNVTFNTYFTSMPTSATCVWRCCLAGTPASQVGLRYAGGTAAIVVDLTEPGRMGAIAEGPYVAFARTGEMPASLRGAVAVAAKSSVTAKPAVPVRAPAAPVRTPPVQPPMDQEEEDSIDVAEEEAEFQGIGLAEELNAGPGETDLAPAAPLPPSETQRPLVRKRITPMILNANTVLRPGNEDVSRAAARRRRQVMLLFGGAILLIAVATALVIVASMTGAPPELPPVPKPNPENMPQAPSAASPKSVAPVPPAPIVVTPAPLPGNQNTVLVPEPKVEEAKPVVSVPVEVGPRYPAVVTVNQLLEFPSAGRGIRETFEQKIPCEQIDTRSGIQKVEIRFPETKGDYPGKMTFNGQAAGTLIASVRPTKPTIAVIEWKEGSGDPVELVAVTLSKQHTTLELSWMEGPLVRDVESVRRAYWVLRASRVEVDWKNQSQEIAFAPFEMPAFSMDAAGGLLMLPTDLPTETVVTPPGGKSLPPGWEATWYTDWEEKDMALRTAANASQVVKLHKATTTEAVEAWFLVKFSPGFGKIENTFSSRLADAQAELAQYESDLRAADADLEQMKKEAGGTLPANSDSVKNIQGKRDEAAALVDAYKAAVAGYNGLDGFDIELTLPNGVRLTTVKFRRAGK